MCVCECLRLYVCERVCIYTYVCVRMCTRTHTHTHTHTHIYIYTSVMGTLLAKEVSIFDDMFKYTCAYARVRPHASVGLLKAYQHFMGQLMPKFGSFVSVSLLSLYIFHIHSSLYFITRSM